MWVKFPVRFARDGRNFKTLEKKFGNACVVIWTTTPWTLPGNRAISYSAKIGYGLYKVTDAPSDNWAKTGDLLILADALAADVFKQARVTSFEKVETVTAAELTALGCAHPLKGVAGAYQFVVPLLDGDHVTIRRRHRICSHRARSWPRGL